jgi:hypothetical protein
MFILHRPILTVGDMGKAAVGEDWVKVESPVALLEGQVALGRESVH